MTLPSYRHDSNENNDVHSLSDITEEIHRTDRTVSNESKQKHQQTQEEHSGIDQHASRSPVRRVLLTFTLVSASIASDMRLADTYHSQHMRRSHVLVPGHIHRLDCLGFNIAGFG